MPLKSGADLLTMRALTRVQSRKLPCLSSQLAAMVESQPGLGPNRKSQLRYPSQAQLGSIMQRGTHMSW